MKNQIRTAVMAVLVLTLITGLLYPLLITGIAQLVFPEKANGSLLKRGNRILGSELVGQPFSDPKYFWGRPSSTAPYPYNAASSGGSNYGPLNPALIDAAQKRIRNLENADSLSTMPVPVDLVTSSASGIDPHISIASALYQTPRVARVRGRSEAEVRALVERCTQGKALGFIGEAHVNVLRLNMALDGIYPEIKGE